jgi:carboxylesterase type B
VGIFGFNLLPALRQEQNLNVGLEDQRLGLEWIQRHIAAFGGDPDNVTIFGEDSGWSNVAYQMMAYGGTLAPTFRRVILQSGPTPGGNMAAGNTTALNVAKVVAAVNCSSPSGHSASELACLRALPLNSLLDAAVEVEYTFDTFGGFGTFRPTAPSRFLPAAPSALLATGRFLRGIDIMTGWNEDDGTVFAPPAFLTNDSTFQAWAQYEFPTLSPSNLAELVSLYPEAEFTDDDRSPDFVVNRNFFRAARVVRDAHFACPTLYLHAAVHSFSPKNKNKKSKRGLYLWAVNQTVLETRHALAGTLFERVDHYADVAYAFASVDRPPLWPYVAPVDYDLASQVSGSWAAFAHFGRPTTTTTKQQEQGQGQVGNVTVAPWEDSVSCGGGGAGRPALRIIGGPRQGMASVYEGKDNVAEAVPLYGERLAERCGGFWNRPDVLAQMGV